jgi:hypothetical protein
MSDHRHHLFSDPHTRTRAELQLIADHHRDVAHAGALDLTPIDAMQIGEAGHDGPTNDMTIIVEPRVDDWGVTHHHVHGAVTHQRIA